MAIDLDAISFAVDTSSLEKAMKSLEELKAATVELAKVQAAASADGARTAKQQAQLEAAQARALKARTQAKEADIKLSITQQRQEELNSKAKQKTITALEKQEAVLLKKTAAEEATTASQIKSNSEVSKASALIEFHNNKLEGMTNGLTSSQAAIIAQGKAYGISEGQLKSLVDTLQSQRALLGGQPFDKSLDAVTAWNNELKVATKSADLHTRGLGLTTKQIDELSRTYIRLTKQGEIQGRSLEEVNASFEDIVQSASKVAVAQNTMRAAMSASDKEVRDAAAANAYLEKELRSVEIALGAVGAGLETTSANRLARFTERMKLSGKTVAEQTILIDGFKNKLREIDNLNSKQKTDYITRAIGPQLTDIGVGLATGQSLLTVMLQQGGQLRDQFGQMGIAGAEMGKTMRTALSGMVVSIKDTGVAFGQLLLGGLTDAGRGVITFAGNMSGLSAVLSDYKNKQLAANGLMSETPAIVRAMGAAFTLASLAIAGAMVGAVAGVIALGVALKQSISENNNLVKALALNAGQFKLSTQDAKNFQDQLQGMGVTTARSTEVLAAMAKQGGFTREEILLVGKAAADMSKYAGVSVEETIKKFAELKQKPVESLLEVAKQTGFVTAETLKSAIAFEDQGNKSAAASSALEAYAGVVQKQVGRIKTESSTISTFFTQLGDNIVGYYDRIFKALFLGSAAGNEKAKAAANGLTSSIKTSFAAIVPGGNLLVPGFDKALDWLEERNKRVAQIADNRSKHTVSGKIGGLESASITSAPTEDEVKRTDAYYQLRLKYMTDVAKKEKEILEFRRQYDPEGVGGVKGEFAARSEEEKARYNTAISKLKDDLAKAKKSAAGSSPSASASLDIVANNELQLIEKRYKDSLTKAKSYANDEKQLLKDQLEGGLILRSEYAARELGLIDASEQQQLSILSETEAKRLKATQERMSQIEAAYQITLARNKGRQGEDEANRKATEDYNAAIKNLTASQAELAEASTLARKEIESQAMVRASAVTRQYNKDIYDTKKALEEFYIAGKAISEQRANEFSLNDQLRWASPEQAAQIKAVAEELKQFAPILRKAQEEVNKAILDFEAVKRLYDDRDLTGDDAATRSYLVYLEKKKNYDTMYAESKLAAGRQRVNALLDYEKQQRKEMQDAITDSIVTAMFDGGKEGAKKLREYLVKELRKKVTMVIDAIINPIIGNIIGALGLGGGAAGSAGGSAAGGAASSLIPAGISAAFSSFGSGIASGLSQFMQGASFVGPSATAAGGATGIGASIGQAIPYVAAALAIANMLGLFRKKKKVGGGLRGTFGEGDINSYDLMRRSGTLISGPSYSIEDRGVSEQSKAIQDAYIAMRTGVVSMVESLGLGADAIRDFTTTVGTDLIHPDTGGTGIKFDGLTAEEAAAKVQEALRSASNEMAMQILGTWDKTTEEITRTITERVGDPENWDYVTRTVTETIETLTYTASEYAREGEEAIDTLTRLATSLSSSNSMWELLGYSLFEASLKGADAASTLVDAFGGIDKFNSTTTAYYNALYSEEERTAKAMELMKKTLQGLGVAMPSTLEGFRALVDAAVAAGDEKLIAQLMALGPAFAELVNRATDAIDNARTTAQDNARTTAQDNALAALRKAIDKEKSLLEERITNQEAIIDRLRDIFDVLDSNIKSLYNEVQSTSLFNAVQGRAVITQAMSTGILPDSDILSEAIGAVRSGMGNSNYTTRFEADNARLVLAADLTRLRANAEVQLTTEEATLESLKKQLDELEAIYENAERQLNELRGINDTLLSVSEALAAFLDSLKPPTNASTNPTEAPSPFVIGGGETTPSTPMRAGRNADGKYVTENYLGSYGSSYAVAGEADQSRLSSLQSVYDNQATGADSIAEAFRIMLDAGASISDIGALGGFSYADLIDAARRAGIPGYANGGMHSGGLRMVGEYEPELEVTGPARYYNGNQMKDLLSNSGDSNKTAEQIEMLRSECRATALNTAKLVKIIDRLVVNTDSGDAIQTKDVV